MWGDHSKVNDLLSLFKNIPPREPPFQSSSSPVKVVPITRIRIIDDCVGQESNPGQLLVRQLCSPLYHATL